MDPASSLKWLLGIAWLLPLMSFGLIVLLGPKMGRAGRHAGLVAAGAIIAGCLLSIVALFGVWIPHYGFGQHHAVGDSAEHADASDLPQNVESSLHLASAVVSSAAHGADSSHHEQAPPVYFAGDWYTLGQFGSLKITIGYYIDSLTLVMFVMVTFIASCIHVYSMGYMHEELHDVTDHEVTLKDGQHLKRHGRYYRFFQYLSLFSFSMLGVVIAGNMAMVFVFWELVGICSYFLIGFYIERKSASNAANKAFIVNRVGDFGMIIGMMALWSGLGTFAFGDLQDEHGQVVLNADGMAVEPGIFSQLRSPEHHYQYRTPDKMVRQALRPKQHAITRYLMPEVPVQLRAALAGSGSDGPSDNTVAEKAIGRWVDGLAAWRSDRQAWADAHQPWLSDNQAWIAKTKAELKLPDIPDDFQRLSASEKETWIRDRLLPIDQAALATAVTGRLDEQLDAWRTGTAPGDPTPYGYWLLIVGGVGIFCGCVGKSAQFPLHVWLPDAMEGPTPVSALVHSATMVAAGVYLVGRFYPAFPPEVLLVIAYIGGVTLFIAATIAITATDIKRVLAYSTVSQLGYMMLALGVGGWLAGMFHLVTHAFFKSLLFLGSGSVIHAVHSNEMTDMGGLIKKMPITAYTMLMGCLAIIGASVPFVIGFSGYYSKDSILEQAWLFSGGFAERAIDGNPSHGILFALAAGGAAITAFYMFRLWYMTFLGPPRDQHRYDHAHESPNTMTVPLIVLAIFAVAVGWPLLGVTDLIEQARPAGTLTTSPGGLVLTNLVHPNEHLSHESAIKTPVTIIAFSTALGGFLLATVIYCWRLLDPREIRQQFRPLYRFLLHKWWFDELYQLLFVRPLFAVSQLAARCDTKVIDGIIHALASFTRVISQLQDNLVDRRVVDGLVNLVGRRTWDVGLSLRAVQTGRLRQYVMFIVIGTVALFLIISFVRSYATAGW